MKIRKQLSKRAAALLSCLCLLLSLSVTAYAHEVPDMTRTGSIAVTMACQGKVVSGGTLTLYRVGTISEDDGNYDFALTEDFIGSRLSLEEITSGTLAEKLSVYASNQGLKGTEVTIGTDGRAAVSDMSLGLYLIVQTRAAEGYEAVSPFLVSVPMNEDGHYVYAVEAAPKMSLLTKKTPEKPPAAKIPQTGQMNWPVPVLAVLGLCLLLLGWELRFGKNRECHET